jgi:hypothetical protein
MVFCLVLRKVMSLLAEDRFCLGSAGDGRRYLSLGYMTSSREGYARPSCLFSSQVTSIQFHQLDK